MPTFHDRIVGIHAEEGNWASIRLEGLKEAPSPGRYYSGWVMDEPLAPLPVTLFPGGGQPNGLVAFSQGLQPRLWPPGTELLLRGPLGSGFIPPKSGQHLALVSIDIPPSRLLPLARLAVENYGAVALFTNYPPVRISSEIEIQPLEELAEALSWADQLALDIPIESVPTLQSRLRITSQAITQLTAQALIRMPMPCNGLGTCGACAVLTERGGYALVCKQGPVFNLNELAW